MIGRRRTGRLAPVAATAVVVVALLSTSCADDADDADGTGGLGPTGTTALDGGEAASGLDTTPGPDGSGDGPAPPEGFPSAATTGIAGAGVDPDDLRPSDSIVVTEDGAVIEGVDVSGTIRVTADDVTIRRSRIRHEAGYGIRADGERLLVEDTTIIGLTPAATASIGLSDYTCRRCDLSGATDGALAYADTVIERSFIHDLRPDEGSHNDGVQGSGGSDVTIRGNTILGPFRTSTSAVLAQSNIAPLDGWRIEGNLLAGGSFAVFLRDKGTGHGPPTDSTVADNHILRGSTGAAAACLARADRASCESLDHYLAVDGTVTVGGNELIDECPASLHSLYDCFG